MKINVKRLILPPVLALLLFPGCSARKYAINKLGDALAQSGSTFASDEDPDLVKQAVPFSLKLIESLLAESPRHQGLLLAATRGFTQFGYAFVQQDADELESQDLAAAEALRRRALKLYLRAHNYGLRGLEARYPGFEKSLRADAKTALRRTTPQDMPFLYWTSAAWAAAISLAKDQPEIVADLSLVEALVDRAEQLNPTFENGALQGFLVSFESTRKGRPGNPDERVTQHFELAMKLAQGKQAGPLVSYAEAMAVKNQNLKEFRSLLNQALAINPDAQPDLRLVNLVMQRRARWLLSRTEELFLIADPPEDRK